MRSIIPQHPDSAPSLPDSGTEEARLRSGERLARLAELDPEQMSAALAFLAGYHPRVFDAALFAVDPCTSEDGPDMEPYCVRCGAPVGIFLARGTEYSHYRGVPTQTSKPSPYKAGHAPVIGWRPAADARDAAAGRYGD